MSRHTRQARLVEVGERGQAMLTGGEARVTRAADAGVVAARYMAGAGFGRIRVRDAGAAAAARAVDAGVQVVMEETAEVSAPPSWLALDDPSARAVALGAYEALTAIRARLGLAPKGRP